MEQRKFTEQPQGVQFVVTTETRPVRCHVTRQALVNYFGACSQADRPDQDCLQAYDGSASLIRQVALFLLQSGQPLRIGGPVITTDDVFHYLVIRPALRMVGIGGC
ncbi:MAG: DUF1488 family protein [Leptothrix sp. (in: b-proteobacteria)]